MGHPLLLEDRPCCCGFLFLELSSLSGSSGDQQDVLLLYRTRGWKAFGRQCWQASLVLLQLASACCIQGYKWPILSELSLLCYHHDLFASRDDFDFPYVGHPLRALLT